MKKLIKIVSILACIVVLTGIIGNLNFSSLYAYEAESEENILHGNRTGDNTFRFNETANTGVTSRSDTINGQQRVAGSFVSDAVNSERN